MGDKDIQTELLQQILTKVEGVPVLNHRITELEGDVARLVETVEIGNGRDSLVVQLDRLSGLPGQFEELRGSIDFAIINKRKDLNITRLQAGLMTAATVLMTAIAQLILSIT